MEQRGISGGAAVVVLALIVALVVVGAVIAIGTPGQRGQAKAERLQSEAIAYQVRQQTDTRAEAERANIRQMERDAAHQRTMDALPYVMLIGGGGVVVLVVILVFWDLRQSRQSATADPGLLVYLAQRDRDLWRAIAHLDRRTLPERDGSGEIIVYPAQEGNRRT